MKSAAGGGGSALHTLRTIARLSVTDAANLADVSVTYLQRVEMGRAVPTRGFVALVTAAIANHITTAETENAR